MKAIPSAIILECRLYKGDYVFIISSTYGPCRMWLLVDGQSFKLYFINEGFILFNNLADWIESEILYEKEEVADKNIHATSW